MARVMRRIAILLSVAVATASAVQAGQALTLDDRMAAQRAIEQVYWRHRIWPKENPGPKPTLDPLILRNSVRGKVEDSLRKSAALETWWRRPITAEQLQAEMNRMARETRDGGLLRELFEVLGNDPALIAETLARPALAERLMRSWYESDERTHGAPFDAWWTSERARFPADAGSIPGVYTLPHVTGAEGCTDDSWKETIGDVPSARKFHVAVWTGTEMIVWGGAGINSGGRYDPATDTWLPTSMSDEVPDDSNSTAVWTGTAMIVWGGATDGPRYPHTGRSYDPVTNSWKRISIGENAPLGRGAHVAVWTGTEMLIWGGYAGERFLSSGARYDPNTDQWTAMKTAGAPIGREGARAVWTGSQMLVWGGRSFFSQYTNSGGLYDPIGDSWTSMSTGAHVPSPRDSFTAVWTGAQMIVWGGLNGNTRLGTGGRYDPVANEWAPMAASELTPRADHTAVWTGTEMIVWGGYGAFNSVTNTGSRYDPAHDWWQPIPMTNVPDPRRGHSAIWTGSEMIVWAGQTSLSGTGIHTNSGGRYNPLQSYWVPTSTTATVPRGRHSHSTVWTGTEMIVWGGDDGTTGKTNTGGRYDPATDSWTATSIAGFVPAPRQEHVAVWTGAEMLVWGGESSTEILGSGGRYDPIQNAWRPISELPGAPSARTGHTGVWTGTELIVWGGFGDKNTGGRYRPASDSWTPTTLTGVPGGRRYHTAVWTGSEMIVWGGIASAFPNVVSLNSGGRYDPIADRWTPTAIDSNTPTGRIWHAAVWTGSQMIVWGGSRTDISTPFFNDGARYEVSDDAWKSMAAGEHVPEPRRIPLVAWTGLELIVWGGQSASSPYEVGSGGRYVPTGDEWKPMSSGPHLPDPRHSTTAVWAGSEMIVWGGVGGDSQRFDSGGAYCSKSAGGICYRDADSDGYGDTGSPLVACPFPPPSGYVAVGFDCDDANPNAHPGSVEICDGADNDCNGLFEDDADGPDSDGDGSGNACDNCRMTANATQSDTNHDGEGDACDLDDGLIYIFATARNRIDWQLESGPTLFNVYEGDLGILRSTGNYTQAPGSNTHAERRCGLGLPFVNDFISVALGNVKFALVTGSVFGVEGSLGTNSAGAPRPNTNPCP